MDLHLSSEVNILELSSSQIWDIIFSHLNFEDMINLRLVSKKFLNIVDSSSSFPQRNKLTLDYCTLSAKYLPFKRYSNSKIQFSEVEIRNQCFRSSDSPLDFTGVFNQLSETLTVLNIAKARYDVTELFVKNLSIFKNLLHFEVHAEKWYSIVFHEDQLENNSCCNTSVQELTLWFGEDLSSDHSEAVVVYPFYEKPVQKDLLSLTQNVILVHIMEYDDAVLLMQHNLLAALIHQYPNKIATLPMVIVQSLFGNNYDLLKATRRFPKLQGVTNEVWDTPWDFLYEIVNLTINVQYSSMLFTLNYCRNIKRLRLKLSLDGCFFYHHDQFVYHGLNEVRHLVIESHDPLQSTSDGGYRQGKCLSCLSYLFKSTQNLETLKLIFFNANQNYNWYINYIFCYQPKLKHLEIINHKKGDAVFVPLLSWVRMRKLKSIMLLGVCPLINSATRRNWVEFNSKLTNLKQFIVYRKPNVTLNNYELLEEIFGEKLIIAHKN